MRVTDQIFGIFQRRQIVFNVKVFKTQRSSGPQMRLQRKKVADSSFYPVNAILAIP